MKYILEKQFWSYKFKRKCALEKIAENYKLKNLLKNYEIQWDWNWRMQISSK